MGKQAKKKQKTEAQVAKQRRHNRATRGMNTKRRPIVWETRQEKQADGSIKTVKVTYPPNLQWDWSRIYDAVVDDEGITRLMRRKPEKQKPLPPPLDTLLDDDWELLLGEYAEEHSDESAKAKVDRIPLGDGCFRHEVWKNEYNPRTGKPERKVLLSVSSKQRRQPKKKRKGKFRKRNK